MTFQSLKCNVKTEQWGVYLIERQIMHDPFHEVRKQIHEIRNLIGPVDLKFADLEHKISTSKIYFDEKTAALEAKLFAALFRLDQQEIRIADLAASHSRMAERIKRFEERRLE